MTTKQVLDLDCREEENREIIQKVLRQIKPLSNCLEEQVPFEKLEKCLYVLCKNYNIFPRSFFADAFASDDGIIWRFEAVDIKDLSKVGQCYGISLYEVLAKAVIMLYAMTRKRRK